MKITLEHNDGKKEVFRDVYNLYMAISQYQPVAEKDTDKISMLPTTKSYSWGEIRELLKEIRQSEAEMQEMLNANQVKHTIK